MDANINFSKYEVSPQRSMKDTLNSLNLKIQFCKRFRDSKKSFARIITCTYVLMDNFFSCFNFMISNSHIEKENIKFHGVNIFLVIIFLNLKKSSSGEHIFFCLFYASRSNTFIKKSLQIKNYKN